MAEQNGMTCSDCMRKENYRQEKFLGLRRSDNIVVFPFDHCDATENASKTTQEAGAIARGPLPKDHAQTCRQVTSQMSPLLCQLLFLQVWHRGW